MTEERQERINSLVSDRRTRQAREELAPQIAEMVGYDVSLDDFLPRSESHSMLSLAVEKLQAFQVKHRIWGEGLRGEMIACVDLLAHELAAEYAYLLSYADSAGAIRVPVAPVLRAFAERMSAAGPDVLLVSKDVSSGVNLGYEHPPNSYEYELRSWGAFAIDLSKVVEAPPISIERMILSVAHNAAREEAEAYCLGMLTYHLPNVRRIAALSLGHIGRINREISGDAIRALVARRDDPELSGTVADALSDIAIFVYGDAANVEAMISEHSGTT